MVVRSLFDRSPLRLAVGFTVLFVLNAVSPTRADEYVLGPQDKLQIKVYDWRTRTAEEHAWVALTGEFQIGSAGELLLPFIGSVQAGGQTPTSLAADLSKKLQARVGLAEAPSTAVAVSQYRPFYITGAVDKPGEYSFRPSLTVVQAVALAGGLTRAADRSALERDALVNRGDLRVLSDERTRLLARLARVDAQLSQGNEIKFPDELLVAKDDPAIARTMKEERLLLKYSIETRASKIESFKQTKILLRKEIETLGQKLETLSRQIEVAKKDLAMVAGLVTRGLALSSRQTALDENISQFQSNQLDMQLAVLRAQQQISKTDQELLAVDETLRDQALKDSQQTRARMAELEEKIDTARGLIYHAETRAPGLSLETSSDRRMTFSISRRVGDDVKIFVVGENDFVMPGDTIKLGPAVAAMPTVAQSKGTGETTPAN